MVRVSDCRSGGWGFESPRPRLGKLLWGNHLAVVARPGACALYGILRLFFRCPPAVAVRLSAVGAGR